MLELCRMPSSPSLQLFSGPLWPEVVAPDRVLAMGEIGINCVLMINYIVYKELFIFIKIDLALNNIHCLMCPKTKPNQTKLLTFQRTSEGK